MPSALAPQLMKRFPVPVFNHDRLKSVSWSAPSLREASHLDEVPKRGCPVVVPDVLAARFALEGEQLHAIACEVADSPVRAVGRSYAWPKQRLLVLGDLNDGEVLLDWTTPRPMNNRLGPQDGATLHSRRLYIISAHAYEDRWIGNRTVTAESWEGELVGLTPGLREGLAILSSAEDAGTHFHDCNLYLGA